MSYTGTTPKELDYTKPDGATEYKNILDDAIKELKTVFQNDHAMRSTATGVTVAVTDSIILCTATLTITLPTASTLAGADPNGTTRIKAFRLVNTGTGTITISGTVIVAGTSTVNPTLATKEEMLIWTDGTSYYGIKIEPVSTRITDGTNIIKTKIIDIGDWNMTSQGFVYVAHGLTYANIRAVQAVIRNDADTTRFFFSCYLTGSADLWGNVGTTNIELDRGTTFNTTDFNSTSYNRGWITITYVE